MTFWDRIDRRIPNLRIRGSSIVSHPKWPQVPCPVPHPHCTPDPHFNSLSPRSHSRAAGRSATPPPEATWTADLCSCSLKARGIGGTGRKVLAVSEKK